MARSFRLNAPLLREARLNQGWSQEELADKAGLSVRVIAKAEAGGAILLLTAQRIAGAFRSVGVAADFLPVVGSPRAAIEPFLQSYRESTPYVDPVHGKLLADSLLARVAGSRREIPFAGTYRGPVGFERLWNRFFTLIRRAGGNLGQDEQFALTGQEVVLWGHEDLRIGGGPHSPPLLVVMQFRVERGLVTRFVLTLDPTAIACRRHGQTSGNLELRHGA